jgi:hypothetical protein
MKKETGMIGYAMMISTSASSQRHHARSCKGAIPIHSDQGKRSTHYGREEEGHQLGPDVRRHLRDPGTRLGVLYTVSFLISLS